MGLKDRLLKAKCAAGFHSGEWKQVAAGSCDERRDCAHCGEVSTRVGWRGIKGVVPVAVPVVPVQGKRCHLLVADLYSGRVRRGVQFSADA